MGKSTQAAELCIQRQPCGLLGAGELVDRRARKEAREYVDLAMVWVGGCVVKMSPETGPDGVLGRGRGVGKATRQVARPQISTGDCILSLRCEESE
eukprot:5740868-Pyramimonas_sp.AAC.1